MLAVREHLDELRDAAVAVITFAPPEDLAAYRRHLDLPFPVLSDPDRELYRAFGLGRGSFRAVYGIGTLRLYARLLRQGHRLRRSTQETRQLGGDFVVDPHGRLTAAFRAPSPDARPSTAQLIDAVREAYA